MDALRPRVCNVRSGGRRCDDTLHGIRPGLPTHGIRRLPRPRRDRRHARRAARDRRRSGAGGGAGLDPAAAGRAHRLRGSGLWPTAAWMVPGVLVGGWLGSRFAIGLDGDVLRWCVAGYCFVAAAQLLFGRDRVRADGAPAPRGPGYTAAGVGIGAVSAVVGIGGGSMTVPLLVWRGVAPVRAVGTSSACGIFIGIGSALGYALQAPPVALSRAGAVGYGYRPAAAGVAVASVLAAPYGTRLAHRLSGRALKRVFAAFLIAVGWSFFFQ